MAKTVGFSRNIKTAWLNKAAVLYGENLTEEQYKTAINEYLAFEISSPTNLRKTREILMHVWYYDDETITGYRAKAYKLLQQHADFDVAIHWCMLLLAYPVFVDLCKLMGKISEFNDVIALSQLKQKLYDEWGERSTLYHSTDKIIATIKEFGMITSDKPGNYTIVKHAVTRSSVVSFMVLAAMKVDRNSYYSFSDLYAFNVLFPFEFKVNKEEFMNDSNFVVSNFGGELSIALKRE